ncbi:hypothetical protein [Hymenobacter guriensis]|uniref:Periplasmic heavy metal sensor n=1 Tax=Hymenobacter guriensis TaxID=2793065 RepID=A0ABS0L5Q9_9BACT|nr:hypothetical protein [Hymenobacter guriensis]MBG8555489.1 hypothetical protein [Hymenobacter guriensis]
MNKFLLLALAFLAAPSLSMAQSATVKTKTKTATGTTTKAKTTVEPAPAPASRPAPTPPADKVEARANALTENMQNALGLNPQQVEKVRQINLTSVRAVETARLQYRQDVRKVSAVVDAVGRSRLSALKDVLSPQQFDRYQRKREEKMGVPSSQGIQGNPAPGLPGGE